jgi:1,2-diacylglycerol 3-beta-galactosyltransferase
VKYPWLWRLNFVASAPGFVHKPMFAAYGAIVARSFAAAFDKFAPDLVVSVHPLMQHVPVRRTRHLAAA